MALDNLKQQIKPNLISIGYQTDNHYDLWYWVQKIEEGLSKVNNLTELQDSVDVLIAGGDNVHSGRIGKQLNLEIMNQWMSYFFAGNQADRFALRGNHDDGSQKPSEYNTISPPKNQVISGDEFKTYLRSKSCNYGEYRDDDSLYCYKDYPKYKVRVVLVDSIDNPEIIDSSGKLKYYGMGTMGFQERQLKWIADKALGTCPEDYHVVMFSHVPINRTQDEASSINHECLINIIKAFNNCTSAEITTSAPDAYAKDFEVDFSVDYSDRGNSNFVGYIAGHNHVESMSEIEGFKVVVCRQSVFEDWQPTELAGTAGEDALQVIQIDTLKRQLILLGLGRSTNRIFSY